MSLVKSLKGNAITIDRDGIINYSYFGDKYDKEKENGNISKLKNITLNSNIKNLLIIFYIYNSYFSGRFLIIYKKI